MASALVPAPVALLFDPNLTAAAKLVWLALRAEADQSPAPGPASTPDPGLLAARTALSRATVRAALAQLAASPWASSADSQPALVPIPADLLREPDLRPHAKLLYGILQSTQGFQAPKGSCTYTGLAATAGLAPKTVRESIRELARAYWIEARQDHQLAPVTFKLCHPQAESQTAEALVAERRLQRAKFSGEAFMKEYLSLLINLDDFADNARPGWLANPLTDERMELDRYYPELAGFEYNGRQHDQTTKRFPSKAALREQKARDLMKEALCARRGIQLFVIRRGDLTVAGMLRRIGARLPLRDLRGHGELSAYLDETVRTHLPPR